MRLGKIQRGHTVFAGKGGCSACHRVQGVGPRTAPDLSDIGALRTPPALQRSLLDSNRGMLPINRPVRIETTDGQHHSRTPAERRHLFGADSSTIGTARLSAQVRHQNDGAGEDVADDIGRKTLTADEVADLVAYLLSLRGAQGTGLFCRTVASLLPSPCRPTRSTRRSHRNACCARPGAAELADLQRHLREPAIQPARRITPANVTSLEPKWVVQNQVFGAWQSSPLVVDGVMYLTQRPNDVMAVDAKTGALFWQYRYTPRRRRASAAAPTTAVSRCSATRCSWARSTRV